MDDGRMIGEMISGLKWLAEMRGYKAVTAEFTGWFPTPCGMIDHYTVVADEMIFKGDVTGITIDMMNLPARRNA